MAMTIVEELWTRIRAAIDDKIIAATNARDQAVAAAATVGDAQAVLDARDDAVAAAATLGDAQTVLTARDQAVTAKDGAVTAQTAAVSAAADAAAVAEAKAVEEVNKLKAGAPAAFDTLLEIANELEDNETERAALANSIAGKADAEHTHTLAQISGVPNTVTATNTGNTIAARNADGNLGVSDPTQPIHAANQRYVDQEVAGKADTSHQHRVVDFPMTERTNWINNSSHPDKFVYTRTDGYLHGDVPTSTSHVANKGYVDARTPEIRAVTTIPTPQEPGVVYLKFG